MKKRIAMLLAVVMVLSVLCGCGGGKAWSGKHEVEIVVENYGAFTLEVDADAAPETASNFLNLVKKGFYDGLTVYRAISGFAIYAGDPNGNGTGTSGKYIYGEFISNGFNNTLSHVRGAVGMARGTLRDSASCQFFILQNDATYLDGDFAIFGKVVAGMDVVDSIGNGVQVIGSDGYIAESNQPAIKSAKVIY